MVYPVISEIGVYGGTFNAFALDNFPWNALTEEPARGPFIMLMTQDGEFVPDIALDYDLADDFLSATITLRPGMQWSNGDPFTTEDLRFKFDEMGPNGIDDGWQTQQAESVEVVDDYTIIYHFAEPRPRNKLDMVHWRGGEWTVFNPSSWLKTWHIDYNEDAEALAMEEGFETWDEAFKWHMSWEPLNDTNKPTTQPWMPVDFSTTARLYERNPYFHQVDAAGQQLPYVDRILSQIVDPETHTLKIVSGEADLAFAFTSMENFTLYAENAAAGNYDVNLIPSFSTGEQVYKFNFSHPDPVRRDIYLTPEFRQALSVAIDRDEINDLIYNGFSKPLQFTVTEFSPLYEPEWGESWTQYDPELANSMLDEIGLSERNSAGIRLDSAGNPLTIIVEFSEQQSAQSVSAHELVKEYWEGVGIGMEIRSVPTSNLGPRLESMEWDVFSNAESNGEMYTTILRGGFPGFENEAWVLRRVAERDIAAGTRTLADFTDGVLPGEEPPAEINALLDVRDDINTTEFGSTEYTFLAQTYFQGLSDGTYSIGTVGQVPIVFIARSNIGNLLDQLPPWVEWGGDLNHFAHQWFFKPE
jgi:peptide/nickel transport system substrate-binding protein